MCLPSTMFPPSLSALYDPHCSLLRLLEDRLHAATPSTPAIIGDVMARVFESQQVHRAHRQRQGGIIGAYVLNI